VAAGTVLEVGSVASTLVLPGDGESTMLITARVGAGAVLRFTPQPTVLAAGCAHRMVVRLALAAGAQVLWREEIVFGRYGEAPGRCHARLDATCDGHPLLRQEHTVGDPDLDTSPAVYGTSRCVGTTLITPGTGDGMAARPPTEHHTPGDRVVAPSMTGHDTTSAHLAAPAMTERGVIGDGVAVLPLAGPGVLVSALGADAAQLRRRLEWGEAVALDALGGSRWPGSGPPPVLE
jgi:urease accessory protein